jgi:peroxiredoxin
MKTVNHFAMKKNVSVLLALLPLLGTAQSPAFQLSVHLKKLAAPAKVYLAYRQGDNEIIDSAAGNNGIFQFKGRVSEPAKAVLVLDRTLTGLHVTRKSDMKAVFLENLSIQVTGEERMKDAVITGSPLTKQYEAYYKAVKAPSQKVVDSLDEVYMAAPAEQKKDNAYTKQLMAAAAAALDARKQLQYEFIKHYPDSYISLDALYELVSGQADEDTLISLYKGLSEKMRKTEQGVVLNKKINGDPLTAVGAMAPDFTQNDVNDHPVKLSDFKGKYVLLDFWASWCGPCRAENPNVVKAYNQYKDKNFTVLGVSLDKQNKKDAWMAAIQADGLTWTQVSDLQFWNNAVARKYSIQAIPQNFLIDPNGRIIAKNLRGEALQQKLAELLK